MNRIHVITGQTATGKTSYAIELAHQIDGEIINCDSRQIYKHLDIITGKDLDKTTGIFTFHKQIGGFDIGSYLFKEHHIPIWLYDVVSPDKPFSPYDYALCAVEVITDILSRNKTPIIVGGTYFYLKNLIYGTIESFVEPNKILRDTLSTKTVEELQNMLKDLDTGLFKSLNHSEQHNPHRLIRKIEILKTKRHPETSSGSSKEMPNRVQHDVKSLQNSFPDIEIEMVGFSYNSRDLLQEQIQKRVEKRLVDGAIDEVTQLLTTYSEKDPGLQTIGYKQIITYLNKQIDYSEMKQEWITKEMQYAKRQMTFMKKDTNIKWKLINLK